MKNKNLFFGSLAIKAVFPLHLYTLQVDLDSSAFIKCIINVERQLKRIELSWIQTNSGMFGLVVSLITLNWS